jgi:hypothetical protein
MSVNADVITIEVAGEYHADSIQHMLSFSSNQVTRIILVPDSDRGPFPPGTTAQPVRVSSAAGRATVFVPNPWERQLERQIGAALSRKSRTPEDPICWKSLAEVEEGGWRLADIFERERSLMAEALALQIAHATGKVGNRLSHVLCTAANGHLLKSAIVAT